MVEYGSEWLVIVANGWKEFLNEWLIMVKDGAGWLPSEPIPTEEVQG